MSRYFTACINAIRPGETECRDVAFLDPDADLTKEITFLLDAGFTRLVVTVVPDMQRFSMITRFGNEDGKDQWLEYYNEKELSHAAISGELGPAAAAKERKRRRRLLERRRSKRR